MKANLQLAWIGSNDAAQLKEWDEFLLKSPRGHYCQLSTWLKSYRSYGFDFDVLIARREQKGPIIGGAGVLRFGKRLLKIMSAPICPIIEIGYEDMAGPVLEAVLDYAHNAGASLLQMHFPSSIGSELPSLLPAISLPRLPSSHTGLAIKSAGAHNEMLWIDFPEEQDDEAWSERLFMRFSQHHRRYIRQAERIGVEVLEATTEAELAEAYSLIEANGSFKGYPTRSWKEFGRVLVEQVNNGQAVVLMVKHQGHNLGAHYGAIAGRRYTYVLGGTVGLGRDLKAGFFLQWAAMKKARQLGLLGFDLTSKGPPEVANFKMGFRPQHITFVEPRYLVFSELRYQIFNWIYPKFIKHRGVTSRILTTFHKNVGYTWLCLPQFFALTASYLLPPDILRLCF